MVGRGFGLMSRLGQDWLSVNERWRVPPGEAGDRAERDGWQVGHRPVQQHGGCHLGAGPVAGADGQGGEQGQAGGGGQADPRRATVARTSRARAGRPSRAKTFQIPDTRV
jgi:hypothetical protein